MSTAQAEQRRRPRWIIVLSWTGYFLRTSLRTRRVVRRVADSCSLRSSPPCRSRCRYCSAGWQNQLLRNPGYTSRRDQRRLGQARALSRSDEVVPGLHERAAHLCDRSPLARALRHVVGEQRRRLRSGQHGSDSRGGFVRRVARTPHYDGVRKDAPEPAVIGLFGIAPVQFELVDPGKPGWRKL